MKPRSPSLPSIPCHRTLGVILAGGRSRRMGGDKAKVTLEGHTLLDWVSRALSQVVSEILVVGREQADGVPAVADALPGTPGPSAGIVTGLIEAEGRSILVVAVDQPWVRPSTLAALLDVRPQPATPLDRHFQVTCSTYGGRSLSILKEAARTQGSLQPVIPKLGGTVVRPEQWRCWGEDGRSWFSVDTPENLQEGRRRYGAPDVG